MTSRGHRPWILSGCLAAVGVILIGWFWLDRKGASPAATGRGAESSPGRPSADPARAEAAPVNIDPVSSREAALTARTSGSASGPSVKYVPDYVRLECRAVDANDTPILGFRALLARESIPAEEEQVKDGLATFKGMTPGQYTLHVQAIGYRNHQEALDLTLDPALLKTTVRLGLDEQCVLVKLVSPEGKRLDAAFAKRDHRLVGGPIRIVVTESSLDKGTELSELAGEEFLEESVLRLQRPIADSNRRPLPADYDGYLRVKLPRPFYASLTIGGKVATCLAVDRGVKDSTFVVHPTDLASNLARVKLRVVDDATRQPVKEARLGLHKFTMLPGASESYLHSDVNGEASFENVPVGDLLLVVSSRTGTAEPRVLTTRAGELLNLGDIPVHAVVGVKVDGRVLDAHGEPVDASIDLTPEIQLAAGTPSGHGVYSTQTDKGTFRFPHVPPGKYSLRALPHGKLLSPTAREILVSNTGLQDLRLTTLPGDTVNIHLDPVRPTPTYVVVKNATGQCLVQCFLGRDALRLIGNLAPGDYNLETHNASGQGPPIPFTVGHSPLDLTVR